MIRKYKILVCGGRDFDDEELLNKILDQYCRDEDLYSIRPTKNNPEWDTLSAPIVIHGGASGADTLADKWAKGHHFEVREYKADWNKHGRSAGPIRNAEMLKENPDVVFAFSGGLGTLDMIKKSKKAGVKVIEVGRNILDKSSRERTLYLGDVNEERLGLEVTIWKDNSVPLVDIGIYQGGPHSERSIPWEMHININEESAIALRDHLNLLIERNENDDGKC